MTKASQFMRSSGIFFTCVKSKTMELAGEQKVITINQHKKYAEITPEKFSFILFTLSSKLFRFFISAEYWLLPVGKRW